MASDGCGCKGIRTCFICEPQGSDNKAGDDYRLICSVCWSCKEVKNCNDAEIAVGPTSEFWRCSECELLKSPVSGSLALNCDAVRKWLKEAVYNKQSCLDFENRREEIEKLFDRLLPVNTDFGILVVPEVLSAAEEHEIITQIDSQLWANSQSGRQKQDYGVAINFKKQKVKTHKFSGLPKYAEKFLVCKWTEANEPQQQQIKAMMKGFEAVELCNLEYSPLRGSHIDPHIDDSWIWGARLVTFNLLASTILTFSAPNLPIDILVFLPIRSVIIVSGPSRFEWLHAIHSKHILARRVACTIRELSALFLPGGEMEKVGKQILETARTFEGRPVNFI